MKINLKTAVIGAAVTLGLASASAMAQPSNDQSAPSSPQTEQQMMRDGGMMGMMQNPEMRQQMTRMMSNCNKMMETMGSRGAASRGQEHRL